ncbi:peptide-methionine (R)-S-oxide reductase MsrB [Loktanella sp. SALINAS62]|uniref:peptide-methionine (R)-S-oxide reductase MsrB n=1 Tax=Loktanella sp. SALINAS62 TaxID=2706124 RepID=UPI001B8D9272|nr:peptide-methionine (R)-S-oxide reductase MsrB [Loktanella sp. SALINAS62]MBS1303991.1 peptide-methionine (R)-S-oxide reductase MsrB [Loktanella sp. SALINAS62]
MTQRRTFLLGGTALIVVGGAAVLATRGTDAQAQDFPVSLTPEEWRARLTDAEYAVLREEATEPAFSSPLNDEQRAGTFICAGCETPVYPSDTKFMSGTGWPSFWDSLDNAVATKTDYKMVLPRTEVHCATCGGHLGHIFDDGPEPTGKRHCLNGVALDFVPETT